MVWGEPWVNGPGWARFCSHGRGCSIGPLRPSIGGWMSMEYGAPVAGAGGVELGPGRRVVGSSLVSGHTQIGCHFLLGQVSKCSKTNNCFWACLQPVSPHYMLHLLNAGRD